MIVKAGSSIRNLLNW